MKILLYTLVIILFTLIVFFGYREATAPKETEPTACTMEAKVCPDGTVLGREGPNCEFPACPEISEVPDDIEAHIDAHADLIRVATPTAGGTASSPLQFSGEARGYWFFEASFPVTLVDWDGRIIAEGYASAEGEWMTEEFVPFRGSLEFSLPEESYSNRGTLIFRKANASGLPEHDDALEIPVTLQ